MKTIKLLFQGDSITDAGRDRADIHNLGNGYPKYAAEMLREEYPDVDFEFINLGISGNRTGQLFDRLSAECIDLKPDIVSIMIGINDIWHRYGDSRVMTTNEQLALNYRCILERIKNETGAKILLLQPYTEGEKQAMMRADVERVKPIVDALAAEYADAYVKTDDLMHADSNYGKPDYFTPDGVHPNETGAKFIAELYVKAMKSILEA